ncbi:hypothetical protein SDJN02_15446 [Cucurbita argyrosperma subsp. argyrosperma]|nr:hypothetical protein SDJN02_15446 [Cucurbita argyrosperma subsp. argyrosperma]
MIIEHRRCLQIGVLLCAQALSGIGGFPVALALVILQATFIFGIHFAMPSISLVEYGWCFDRLNLDT